MTQNRAMLLTPPMPGAIAVVRLRGPGIGAFLRNHFSAKPAIGRCVHGTLSDANRVIDDPVVTLFADGDGAGADISLHGGPWIVQSVLDLVERNGFDLCAATDESATVEFADGSSILDREIAAAIPMMKTELGLRVLLSQRHAWNSFIAGHSTPAQTREVLADKSLHHLMHPPTLAIIGAPNVGKSTLANQLFGQERSITADLPGTTRDWVGEIANIDGLPVMLIDTPGVRASDDAIEQAAIAQSQTRAKSADLVMVVLDATCPLDAQQSLLSAYPNAMRVVNKCDGTWRWNVAEIDVLQTIATTSAGIDNLRERIVGHFLGSEFDFDNPVCWTDRQLSIVRSAVGDPQLLRAVIG